MCMRAAGTPRPAVSTAHSLLSSRAQASLLWTLRRNTARLTVHIDGKEVLATSFVASSSFPEGCSASTRSFPVDIIVPHQGETATVSLSVTGGGENADDLAGVFAVTDVLLVAGSAIPKPFPASGVVLEDDFGDGVTGWSFVANRADATLPDTFVTTCNGMSVLGGHHQSGRGVSITKSWSGLPQSEVWVLVSVDYLAFDTWDGELATVEISGDDDSTSVVWSRRIRRTSAFQRCSEGGSYQKFAAELLLRHPGFPDGILTLRATSTLNEDPRNEAFGVTKVMVQTVDISSVPDAPDPLSSAPWPRSGRPDLASSRGGWYGRQSKAISCGAFGWALAVRGWDGYDASLFTTYQNLPPHNKLRFRATVIPTFAADGGPVEFAVRLDDLAVFIADALAPQSLALGDNCTQLSADRQTSVLDVDVVTSHSASSVHLWLGAVAGTISRAHGTFGVWLLRDVEVSPMTFGTGRWRAGSADFSASSDDWDFANPGAANAGFQQNCQTFHVLGGWQHFGRGASASKVYTDLPKHQQLIIQVSVVVFSRPEAASTRVFADGEAVTTLEWAAMPPFVKGGCRALLDVPVSQATIAVILRHNGSSVELKIDSTQTYPTTQVSWGLRDVVVRPVTECQSGEYELHAPTERRDRVCAKTASCGPSTFEERAPTATSDRLCSACSTCPSAHRQLAACGTARDTVCERCDRCVAGREWVGAACSDDANTVCRPCSGCPDGSFVRQQCRLQADTECAACTRCLQADGLYEIQPCTRGGDAVCAPLRECTENQFELVPPTRTTNRVCAELTSCGEDEYEVVPPTDVSDRQCKAATRCASGEFQIAAPTVRDWPPPLRTAQKRRRGCRLVSVLLEWAFVCDSAVGSVRGSEPPVCLRNEQTLTPLPHPSPPSLPPGGPVAGCVCSGADDV